MYSFQILQKEPQCIQEGVNLKESLECIANMKLKDMTVQLFVLVIQIIATRMTIVLVMKTNATLHQTSANLWPWLFWYQLWWNIQFRNKSVSCANKEVAKSYLCFFYIFNMLKILILFSGVFTFSKFDCVHNFAL